MKESEGPTYIGTRTRIAICLLTVTKIRIGELLPLKVGQLETLLKEDWISINLLKKDSANHKAFLTSEGKKIVKARKRLLSSLVQSSALMLFEHPYRVALGPLI